jgi:hypothetical protein
LPVTLRTSSRSPSTVRSVPNGSSAKTERGSRGRAVCRVDALSAQEYRCGRAWPSTCSATSDCTAGNESGVTTEAGTRSAAGAGSSETYRRPSLARSSNHCLHRVPQAQPKITGRLWQSVWLMKGRGITTSQVR